MKSFSNGTVEVFSGSDGFAIAAVKRFDAGRRGEVDLQPGERSVDDGGGEAAARYGYVAPDVWLEIAYHACGVVCQNARVYEPSAGVKHHEGEITVDIVLENSDYSPPCRYWRATAKSLRAGIGERQTERKRENCAAYPCHWQKVHTIAIAKASKGPSFGSSQIRGFGIMPDICY